MSVTGPPGEVPCVTSNPHVGTSDLASHYESDILGFIGTSPTPNPYHTVLHRGAPVHFFVTSRYVAHLLVPYKDMMRQAKLHRTSAQEQLPLSRLPRVYTILGGTVFNSAPDGRVILCVLISTPEPEPREGENLSNSNTTSNTNNNESKQPEQYYRLMIYGQYSPAQADQSCLCGDVQTFYLHFTPTFISHTQLLTPIVSTQTGSPSASPSVLVQSILLNGFIAPAPIIYTDITIGGSDRCIHVYRTTGIQPIGINVNETPAIATSQQGQDTETPDQTQYLRSYIITINQVPNVPQACTVSPPNMNLPPRKIWLPDYILQRDLVTNNNNEESLSLLIRANLKKQYKQLFGQLHFLPSLFHLDLIQYLTPMMPPVMHIPTALQHVIKKKNKTSTDHCLWRTPLVVYKGKVLNKHILDLLGQFPKQDHLKHITIQSSKSSWLPSSLYSEISAEKAGVVAFQHLPTAPLCFNTTINDITGDRIMAVGCQNGLVRMQVTYQAFPRNLIDEQCICQMPVDYTNSHLFTQEAVARHLQQCQCIHKVWAYAPLRFVQDKVKKTLHALFAGEYNLVASRHTSRMQVLHRLWQQDILKDSDIDSKLNVKGFLLSNNNNNQHNNPGHKKKSIVTQRILPGPVTCLRAFSTQSKSPYAQLDKSELLDKSATIANYTNSTSTSFTYPTIRTFLVHPHTLYPSLYPDSNLNLTDFPLELLSKNLYEKRIDINNNKDMSMSNGTSNNSNKGDANINNTSMDYHLAASTATGHAVIFHNINTELLENSSAIVCHSQNATIFHMEVFDANSDGVNDILLCSGNKLIYTRLYPEKAQPFLPTVQWDLHKPSVLPSTIESGELDFSHLSQIDPVVFANTGKLCLDAFTYKQYAELELSQSCSSLTQLPKPIFYATPQYTLMELLVAQQAHKTHGPWVLPPNTGVLALKKRQNVDDGVLLTCGAQGISFYNKSEAYTQSNQLKKKEQIERIKKMQLLQQEQEEKAQ